MLPLSRGQVNHRGIWPKVGRVFFALLKPTAMSDSNQNPIQSWWELSTTPSSQVRKTSRFWTPLITAEPLSSSPGLSHSDEKNLACFHGCSCPESAELAGIRE